jgi:hypothetical protein
MAETDAALLVAHHDKSGETKTTAALHNLRNAIDVDEAVDEFAVPLLPIVVAAAAAFFTRHVKSIPSLNAETPDSVRSLRYFSF